MLTGAVQRAHGGVHEHWAHAGGEEHAAGGGRAPVDSAVETTHHSARAQLQVSGPCVSITSSLFHK